MRYLLLPCQRFCVIHVHHPARNVSLLNSLFRLIHNQVNTKGPVNYTHISKVTYCIIIISSKYLFWILRYLNTLLHVAELLLRSLVKKLLCCCGYRNLHTMFELWVFATARTENSPHLHLIISLRYVLLLSPQLSLPAIRFNKLFFNSISPPLLLHKLLTTSSWYDKYKCNKLSIAPITKPEISTSLATTPPPPLKLWVQFFLYPRLLLLCATLPTLHTLSQEN